MDVNYLVKIYSGCLENQYCVSTGVSPSGGVCSAKR